MHIYAQCHINLFIPSAAVQSPVRVCVRVTVQQHWVYITYVHMALCIKSMYIYIYQFVHMYMHLRIKVCVQTFLHFVHMYIYLTGASYYAHGRLRNSILYRYIYLWHYVNMCIHISLALSLIAASCGAPAQCVRATAQQQHYAPETSIPARTAAFLF